MTNTFSNIRLIRFRDVTQWYVGYYLNNVGVDSAYPLVFLRDIISPRRSIIKKDVYDGVTPIVEKIVFKTGQIVFRETKETGMNLCALKQNDLLVSSINFHQGATALNTYGDIVASTHYQAYQINTELVIPEYLIMVLRSPRFLSVVSGRKANGIKNESGYGFIGSFKIPVPSLDVQNKIIKAKNSFILQSKKQELEAGKIEKDIEDYLLTELGITPITRHQEDLKSSGPNQKGRNSYLMKLRFKDIDRWDCYNIFTTSHSSLYPNVKLSQIITSKPQYGAGYSAKGYDGITRYIRITDINDDGSLNEEKVSANGYSNRYLLKENDFLIARSGNTVGKTFLYKGVLGRAIYAGYLIRFELDTTKVLPEYLLYYTKCSAYRNWISSNMRVSAQPNINSRQYLDSPIVLPPISIQSAIVNQLEHNKRLISQIKQKAVDLQKEALEEFENKVFK